MTASTLPPHKNKIALVVDNQRLFVELLSDILEENGYEVIKAYDGMEAIKALKTQRFSLIFLDLIMPRVDGVKVLKYVRQNPLHSETPVVIVSGTILEEESAIQNLGADAYIPKGSLDQVRSHVIEFLSRLSDKQKTPSLVFPAPPSSHPRPIVSELLKNKRHMELVLDKIGEGVIEVDPEWNVALVNPAALQIVGKSESEVIGNHIGEIFSADWCPALARTITNLIDRGGGTQELATVSYNDRVLKLHTARLLKGKDLIGHLIMIEDITSLTDQINSLEKAQSQLFESAKFAALLPMAVNISHEINNPLTNILGYASLLLDDESLLESQRETIRLIKDEAIRTRTFIKELLVITHQVDLTLEDVAIPQEIRNVLSLVRTNLTSKEIVLHESYERDIPAIKAYPIQLKLAFLNIITNALDAMPAGGRLSITASRGNNNITIAFADTGQGMSTETLNKIFNPFFTTKDKNKNLGLGLPITLGIVKRHHGSMEIQSRHGEGTTMTITLPMIG